MSIKKISSLVPMPAQGAMQVCRKVLLLSALLALAACSSTGLKSAAGGKGPKLENDKAMIHAQLARSYMQQEQYAVARDELNRALSIDPRHSMSNYIMALLMIKLSQYKDAETYFERAVKNDPENAAAAHDFGTFLCQLSQERRSLEYFELAANNPLFERSELSYMRAGECLEKVGDARAESYLKRALSVNPRLRPALFRLAKLKNDAGAHFSARAYIERLLAITKPQPDSLLLAYKIESNLKAAEVAERYRSQLLENFPGSEQAGLLRAEAREAN